MHYLKILAIVLLAAIWISCEKELDITDFEDEFGNYRPELKIEGLLQQDKPEDSIIRIIRTSTVTNTDVFNGIDDDGDGDIDEEDEILPLIEDASATVKITNLSSGETIDFQYMAAADSIVRLDSNDVVFTIPYGGYKPVSSSFQLETYAQYRLEIYSATFDKTITGVTTVYPAVEFIDTLFAFNGNQITMNADDQKEIFWKSDPEVTAYYITYEELTLDGAEFLGSDARAADNDLSEKYASESIGREFLFGFNYETTLRLTVETLSPEWGRYIFSELPLKDPQRTNLRDENGNPVMGCFGASAATQILIEIEE